MTSDIYLWFCVQADQMMGSMFLRLCWHLCFAFELFLRNECALWRVTTCPLEVINWADFLQLFYLSFALCPPPLFCYKVWYDFILWEVVGILIQSSGYVKVQIFCLVFLVESETNFGFCAFKVFSPFFFTLPMPMLLSHWMLLYSSWLDVWAD